MAITTFCLAVWSGFARAQTIQPVITEYHGSGDGKFAVTNNSRIAMIVVLEPRSFDVNETGKGVYRELDRTIHVELSSMSFTLQPEETHYVFYHASAERLPAWFTVYASFSAARHGDGLDVRLLLPHTVYLYGKHPVEERQVQITALRFDAATQRVTGMLENTSDQLVRVQSVKANGGHGTGDLGGFPLLPGRKRQLEMAWTGGSAPTSLEFRMGNFTVKRSLAPADTPALENE